MAERMAAYNRLAEDNRKMMEQNRKEMAARAAQMNATLARNKEGWANVAAYRAGKITEQELRDIQAAKARADAARKEEEAKRLAAEAAFKV